MPYKKILFILSILILPGICLSQNKYREFMEEGVKARDELDFIRSINYFEAAKLQAVDAVEKQAAFDGLEGTFRAMEKVRKDIEEKNKRLNLQNEEIQKQAKELEKIAEASRLALSSRLELEKGEALNALRLAKCAADLKDTVHLPFIDRTFGDAMYSYFRKEIGYSQEGFHDIQFSPNGNFVLALTSDTVFIWDKNYEPIAQIPSTSKYFKTAEFSPDEQKILTTGMGDDFHFWNLTGDFHQTFSGHEDPLNGATFSPDGESILSWSRDSTVRIWDLEGNNTNIFKAHSKNVIEAQFSEKGDKVITRSADLSAKLWDLESGSFNVFRPHVGWVFAANFSSIHDLVVTASAENVARIWNLEGSLDAVQLAHDDYVTDAFFSNKGDKILTVSIDRTAKIWDLNGNLIRVLGGHEGWVTYALFSPNDRYIITASENHSEEIGALKDHNVRIWDTESDSAIILSLHTKDISSITFPQNNNSMFLTTAEDGTAKLWNMHGELMVNLVADRNIGVNKAVFTPDAKYILIASELPYLIKTPIPGRAREILSVNPLPPFSEEEKIFFDVPDCN